MSEWQPIETAPKRRAPMIVVIGVYRDYLTDPWCAWWSHGKWERWPHPYEPTHWMPLPEPPRREPLTEEKVEALIDAQWSPDLSPSDLCRDVARAVERAHGIGTDE